MPAGLRAADAPKIQGLCQGDKRLLMRVGALLEAHVSISEAILEEIKFTTGIRNLLMDRSLKGSDESSFDALIEKHELSDVGIMLSKEEDDWICIHLEDEVNNLFSDDDQSSTDDQSTGNEQWQQTVNEMLPSLHTSMRAPIEGLLAAQGDDQRAAAIEQLRYAGPTLSVVTELMPVILADGADIVRERGIGLLTASGASPVVTDIIRALQRNDLKTLDRLHEHVGRLPSEQKELIFAALIANASRGELSNTIVNLSCELAEVIATHRGLSRYLELLLLHGSELGLVRFVRLMQAHNADEVDDLLRSFIGQSKSGDAKIFTMLAHDKAQLSSELMHMGVNLLLSSDDEPKERMGLANALRRMNRDSELGHLIAEYASNLDQSRDSTVYWLLAELSRSGLVDEVDANTISEQIRLILRRADGPHTVSILDQQLPSLLPCDERQRQRMVEPLAELLARFRDERSRDQIDAILTDMSDAAIDPLWSILKSHPKTSVRIACAEVIPRLIAEKSDDQKHEAIQTLRTESKSLQSDEEKGRYYLAAAKLMHSIDEDRGICEALNEDCKLIGPQTIDASAYIISSSHIQVDRRLQLIEYMLNLICAELPEGKSEETLDPTTDEITYVLDSNLSMHTDLVPRVLEGLEIVCASDHLPPQLLRRICITLINQWRKVSRWEVIWGPANIHQLAKSLAHIAGSDSFPESLRLQVAESLAPRANQIRIADYLVNVFLASSSKRIHKIAGKAVLRIINECNKNQYAEDEYGDLAHILAQFLTLPNLEEDHELLYVKIARTISIYQAQCNTRTREFLLNHRDSFSDNVVDQLDWLNA